MPACQVGNLEYALSLDPSNTLLQKRLSEAKVGFESDAFFGIIFVVGRGWWFSFREEDKGFRFRRISRLRRSLLLVMFRITATGFWGLLLLEEILHELGYLSTGAGFHPSTVWNMRRVLFCQIEKTNCRSTTWVWRHRRPKRLAEYFSFCSIPLAIENDQACCPYILILTYW